MPDRLLDVVPDRWAGVVNGEQQPGLRGDVLEVAHQGRAVLAGLQVLVASEVTLRLKQLGKGILKLSTGHGFVHGAHHNHAICSFRWPVLSRSRSFMRALCSCDLLFPMEQSSISAI